MKIKTFMWLFVIAMLWGPTFLFVELAVEDIPPLTLVAARVSLAALVLYMVLRFQGRGLPAIGPIWKHFAIAGLLYNMTPYVLLSWGQQYVDSALAGILIGATPLFTMIMAHLVTTDDHMTPAKMAGVLLGFGGLILLVGPALMSGVQATTWGLLAALMAAVSYGAGTVYTRMKLRGLPPLVGPAAQLTMAAVYLAPLALLIEQPYRLPAPSWIALGALLLLAIPSTAVAFIVYYRAMETTSATVLSMIAYMVPIVATVLGVVVLGEQLTWNAYLGFALVILGMMIVNGLFQSINWRSFNRTRTPAPTLAEQVKS